MYIYIITMKSEESKYYKYFRYFKFHVFTLQTSDEYRVTQIFTDDILLTILP